MKPGLLLHAVALTAGFGLIFLAVVATAANGWWPWVAILGVVLLTVVLATLRQNRGEVPAQSPGLPAVHTMGQMSVDDHTDLVSAASRLSALIDIRTVYRGSAAILSASTKADRCIIFDFDRTDDVLRQSEPRGGRVDFSTQPVLRDIVNGGDPVVAHVHDPRLSEADRLLLHDHHMVTLLTVPMRVGDQVTGVARLLFDTARDFSSTELSAAQVLANQAGLSIQNARAVHIIAEDRDRLAAVLNATHDGVLLLDASGKVLLTNPRLEEFIGLRGYRLYGKPLTQLLDDPALHLNERLGMAQNELTDLLRSIRAGLALSFAQVEFTSQLPRVRHFERTGAPVLDSLDRAIGWVIVLRDVTEERELQRARDSLSNMIVHDLRGPLAAIQTGLMFVRDRTPADRMPALALQAIDLALRACNRLLGLVNALLDIAKMESGELQLQRRPVGLAALARDVAEEMTPLAREQGLTIAYDVAEHLPPVPLDPEKVTRVLNNLVDNALKFTPAGGTITLVADHNVDGLAPNEIRLGVLDTGPGIPDEYLGRVFDRWVQVAGRKGSRTGSGLGLSFCKLTVEAHGGRIWVANRPEGGSAFYFTLPLA